MTISKNGKNLLAVFRCKECYMPQCCREEKSGGVETCFSLACTEGSRKCESEDIEILDGGAQIICVRCQLKKASALESQVLQKW